MKRSNATFTLERVEGERVTPIWSERICATYVFGPTIVADGYGARWIFWGNRRCGLYPSEAEWATIRLVVTVDEPEPEIVGDCVGDLIDEYPATM
jgi:hypothetical protein